VAKKRSPNQVAISISLSKSLLGEIDHRASAMGMTRSHYLAVIARLDINDAANLKDLPVDPAVTDRQKLIDATIDFLILALKHYEKGARNDIPEPPDSVANDPIWNLFLDELEKIAEHKWNKSKETGYDIGPERAIVEWLAKHRPDWIASWDRDNTSLEP